MDRHHKATVIRAGPLELRHCHVCAEQPYQMWGPERLRRTYQGVYWSASKKLFAVFATLEEAEREYKQAEWKYRATA